MTCIFPSSALVMLQEHYEAVMRRTMERSQRVEQRQKRWSWGGLITDQDGRAGRGPFCFIRSLSVSPFTCHDALMSFLRSTLNFSLFQNKTCRWSSFFILHHSWDEVLQRCILPSQCSYLFCGSTVKLILTCIILSQG